VTECAPGPEVRLREIGFWKAWLPAVLNLKLKKTA
jgi:hypothetical protein